MGGKMRKEYFREYYHKNKDYRERTLLLSKFKKIKNTVMFIREMIMVKTVKMTGKSAFISLPKYWAGKDVLIIDTKLFEKDIRKDRV